MSHDQATTQARGRIAASSAAAGSGFPPWDRSVAASGAIARVKR
jgi:hypothetical protein